MENNKTDNWILKKLSSLYYYIRSHLWVEMIGAVLLFFLLIMLIMQKYLKNIYLEYLMQTTTQTEEAMLRASSMNLSSTMVDALELSGQIAINKTLREAVDKIEATQGTQAYRELLSLYTYLLGLTYYSNDIAAVTIVNQDGVLLEGSRYWYSGTSHNLWEKDQAEIISKLYEDVTKQLDQPQAGHYSVSARPSVHEQIPQMKMFHIAVPLIGKSSDFSHVNDIVIVSFKFNNVINASSMGQEIGQNNVIVYLKDENENIIYSEDESFVGKKESDIVSGSNLTIIEQSINKFNWVEAVAIDNESIREDVNHMYNVAILIYILLMFACYFLWYALMHYVLRPVSVIRDAMDSVQRGNEEKSIQIEGCHEIWQLAIHYNEMLKALQEQKEVVKRQYEEKSELIKLQSKAEQKALESQINAHFLCNTLNAINYDVMESGNDEISLLLKNLSNILRYSFARKSDEVTVGMELDWVSQYLYLQKYRLMDKFNYEINFPEEYNDWPCCKLFIQPFVENSILHGFENKESGGMIRITGEARGGVLIIRIIDNGCGMSEEMCRKIGKISHEKHDLSLAGKGNGVGTANVLTRLKMFYGEGFNYRVSSVADIKTMVELVLPLPSVG